jgi:DNA-binding IscR family transcriptional regulator
LCFLKTDEIELGFLYDFIELYTEMVEKKNEPEKRMKIPDAKNKAQWNKISTKIEKFIQEISTKRVVQSTLI